MQKKLYRGEDLDARGALEWCTRDACAVDDQVEVVAADRSGGLFIDDEAGCRASTEREMQATARRFGFAMEGGRPVEGAVALIDGGLSRQASSQALADAQRHLLVWAAATLPLGGQHAFNTWVLKTSRPGDPVPLHRLIQREPRHARRILDKVRSAVRVQARPRCRRPRQLGEDELPAIRADVASVMVKLHTEGIPQPRVREVAEELRKLTGGKSDEAKRRFLDQHPEVLAGWEIRRNRRRQ